MAPGSSGCLTGLLIESRLVDPKEITMHWLTITGIVLVAIGTGVVLYGGVLQNRREASQTTEQVAEKIQSAMDRMEKVQVESAEGAEEVEQVRDEFRVWAERFLENRGERHIAIQRARLSTIEEQMELTERVQGFLTECFEITRRLLEAYNSASGQDLEIDIPSSIPENVFQVPCSGSVRFNDGVKWRVQVRARKGLPDFLIDVVEPDRGAYMMLSPHEDDILVISRGEDNWFTEPVTRISRTDPNALRNLLTEIVEVRLYDMNSGENRGGG